MEVLKYSIFPFARNPVGLTILNDLIVIIDNSFANMLFKKITN